MHDGDKLANREGGDWAGGDAGATASAFFRINLGQRAATDARREADGSCITVVAANATFNPLVWQAAGADERLVGPGLVFLRLCFQGLRCAGLEAIAAEGAFATGEIDGRETAVAADDDLFRAGAQAIVAARATVSEFSFGERPGRANFSLGARSTAKEAPTAGIDHVLFALLHLVDATTQHLVNF